MTEREWFNVESLDLDAQGVAHRRRRQGGLHRRRVAIRRSAVQRPSQEEQLGAGHDDAPCAASRRSACVPVARISVCMPARAAAARCSTSMRRRRSPSSSARSKTTCGIWARCKPDNMLRPLEGPAWHYRYRARLSVRYVVKEGRRADRLSRAQEPLSGRHAACARCCPPQVSDMLMPLRELDRRRWMRARPARRSNWPAATRPKATRLGVIALVLRHLEPLSAADIGAPEGLCCAACGRAVVAASQGAGDGASCWSRAAPRWPTSCRSSASRCRSSRPISRRSIRTSTARW